MNDVSIPVSFRPATVATSKDRASHRSHAALMIRGNPEPARSAGSNSVKALMQGDPRPIGCSSGWQASACARPCRCSSAPAPRASTRSPTPPRRCANSRALRNGSGLARAGLVEQGQHLFQRMGRTADFALRDVALWRLPGLGLNKTLILTGALAGGNARRVAGNHAVGRDCTQVGGCSAALAGYTSTLHVRLMHAMVRRPVSKITEWNLAELGLPINQTDMAPPTSASAWCCCWWFALGVPVTRTDAHAEMHMLEVHPAGSWRRRALAARR